MSQHSLAAVSTSTLQRLRDGLVAGRVKTPVNKQGLIAFGIREQATPLLKTLQGFRGQACIAIIETALAEREASRKPAPELVWTGPEGTRATARDTAVLLRGLFREAKQRVIVAGYTFLNSKVVLGPLHEAMRDRGVEGTFFVDVDQVDAGTTDPEARLQAEMAAFLAKNWPFGEPRPKVYCDRRAATPGPPWSSLHAKCVVVDGEKAFLSSANFTRRGQERNIEVGVLIEDRTFAGQLERQWLGLVQAGLVLLGEG